MPTPQFPTPFLSFPAERFDLDVKDILDVFEAATKYKAEGPYVIDATAEAFESAAKLIRNRAAHQGVKLKMSAMNDLFSRAHFDRPYSVIVGLLSAGELMDLDCDSEYLSSACSLYRVNIDPVYEALRSTAIEVMNTKFDTS